MYYYSPYDCDHHEDRRGYYGVSGIPDSYFDGYGRFLGGSASGTTYDDILPIVQEHLLRPSLLNMSLDLTIDGSSGEVSGAIEALGDVPAAYVYVVVYEDPAPREPHLARVFPVWQEPLTALRYGQTQDISGAFTVDAGWVAGNLHAIMFVQHLGTGPMIFAGPGPGPDNPTDVYGYLADNLAAPEMTMDCYGVDRFGVNLAAADLDADGLHEVITGPGPGAVFGPQVRGFSGSGNPISGVNFLAYGTNKYGVNVAAGDIDGDGFDEMITGAGPGAVFGPHVRGWNYDDDVVDTIPGVSYFAYGTPKWGVNVAAGDIDGDGYAEIITGAGPGAVYGPHVRGWNHDGAGIDSISQVSWLAYGTNKWGVNVCCGDVDGDGIDEMITGAGPGAVFAPHVRGWNWDGTGTTESIGGINFFAFDYTQWGAYVGAGDVDSDGFDELLVGPGPGESHETLVRIYNYDDDTLALLEEFTAFDGEGLTHGTKATVGFH